jgi:hypothetical protein
MKLVDMQSSACHEIDSVQSLLNLKDNATKLHIRNTYTDYMSVCLVISVLNAFKRVGGSRAFIDFGAQQRISGINDFEEIY